LLLEAPGPERDGDGKEAVSFGLAFTDDVLNHGRLSPTAKLVLAATVAHPNRELSLSELVGTLPGNRDAMHEAQDELERVGIARYDRPKEPWERHADNPRF